MPRLPKTGAIDEAEAWIIATRDATYREAAANFGVSMNSIRARISNKYGSLSGARLMGRALVLKQEDGRMLRPIRRCMTCGKSSNIEVGHRRCQSCKKEAERIHDGIV